jgi:hypothetical protein
MPFSGGTSSSGGSSSLTVEEVDGSPTDSAVTKLILPNGTLAIASHEATYTPASSGGFTHAYLGYNTAGGSSEAMDSEKVYAKKITVSSAGILTSIGAYCDNANVIDSVTDLSVAIYDDSAGTPNNLIYVASNTPISSLLDDTSGAGGNQVARWFHCGCGMYLTAADYWVAVKVHTNSNSGRRIYYDGSGSDRTYLSGGDWFADWGYYSPTTTANKYSIRASIIT